MKYVLSTIFACLLFTLAAQPVETHVNSNGLSLKDNAMVERITLDGNTKRILIAINDSLSLDIQGGLMTFIKVFNTQSGAEIGIEIDQDGAFGFGEFGGILVPESLPITSLRNGIFRPAPNTQAIATDFQERLRINPDGNIGIGTLEPLERLHIDGNIRIESLDIDPTLEDLLVIDPVSKVVKTRPASSLILPSAARMIRQDEEQDLVIRELLQRIEVLEKQIEGK